MNISSSGHIKLESQPVFNVEGFVDLSLEIKQAIYRITQEALANVARHSSADNVEIALYFLENRVEFSVSDDGSGFDAQEQHAGMGLEFDARTS